MKSPINKIIVNVNYSDNSLNAVNTAINMCKRHGAELHLLYVMKISDLYPSEGFLGPIAKYNDSLLKRDLDVFSELAATIKNDYSVDCTLHHDINSLSVSISEKATQLDCDLIVMPAEEEGGRFAYLLHSTAYSVFKNANCSVLTIPATKSFDSFRNVLFPVRESKDIQDKYFFARSIFKKNNANVSIVGILKEHGAKKTSAIREIINDARSWMKKDQLFYTSSVTFNSDSALAAMEMGKNEESDLIVINASTNRNLWEFLFGSYTQRLIKNKHFAVLCFKPKRIKIPIEEKISFDQTMAMA